MDKPLHPLLAFVCWLIAGSLLYVSGKGIYESFTELNGDKFMTHILAFVLSSSWIVWVVYEKAQKLRGKQRE